MRRHSIIVNRDNTCCASGALIPGEGRMRHFWTTTVLIVIIAGALILRFYAVEWGLPYVDHPDEPTTAKTVLEMLRRGDWNPGFFEKPSLYYYALRVIFEAHWRYGLATGLYSDISQLPLGTYFY